MPTRWPRAALIRSDPARTAALDAHPSARARMRPTAFVVTDVTAVPNRPIRRRLSLGPTFQRPHRSRHRFRRPSTLARACACGGGRPCVRSAFRPAERSACGHGGGPDAELLNPPCSPQRQLGRRAPSVCTDGTRRCAGCAYGEADGGTHVCAHYTRDRTYTRTYRYAYSALLCITSSSPTK
jgi:hypothetical protein